MNIAEKISNIKKLLFDTATPAAPATPAQQAYTPAAPAAPVAPVAPAAPVAADYTLLDGTKVTCTTMAVGGDVLVNGQPAPAGTYVFADNSSIVVDDAGKITQVIPAPVVAVDDNTIQDMTTPQAMAAAIQKFATGTSDQQLANLWQVVAFMFKDRFGWQIKQAEEQQAINGAIGIINSSLTPLVADFAAVKVQAASQVETMKLIFEAVSELAGKPTGETPEPPKLKFAYLGAEKPGSKAEKFAETQRKFMESLKEKKTA